MNAKTIRPSCLKGELLSFEQLTPEEAFYTQIREALKRSDEPLDIGVWAVSVLAALGFSFENCIMLVARFEKCAFAPIYALGKRTEQWVYTAPVHLLETGPYFNSIFLDELMAEPFKKLARLGECGLVDTPIVLTRNGLRKRARAVRRGLNKHYKAVRTAYFKRYPGAEQGDSLKSLRDLVTRLNNEAITQRNIEPAWKAARGLVPLPVDIAAGAQQLLNGLTYSTDPRTAPIEETCGTHTGQHSALASQFRHKIEQQQELYRGFLKDRLGLTLTHADLEKIRNDEAMDELFYQYASDCCEERPKGWFDNTKRLIKVFTDLIQDEQWVLHPTSDGEHENALLHQIERFIMLNDEALGAFSLPSLAILWVSESLLLGRINRQTARNYLNGLTLRTGLRHSMAHDMRLWDEECVEALLESIEIRDLSTSTNVHRSNRALAFLRYCKQHMMLANTPIPAKNSDYFSYVRRNHYIRADHYAAQLETYCGAGLNSIERQATFCVAFLTYYAGLRSDEVYNLSLKHIQIYESAFVGGEFGVGQKPHMAIKVIRGKTHNAKRTEYLHVHAPKSLLEWFAKVVQQCRNQGRGKPQKRRLVGGKGAEHAYHSQGLKNKVRKEIKRLFNVNVHTLRHCFATNVELRYLAAKYPETRTLLNLPWDEDPFTPEGLSAFLKFLNWGHREKFEQHCHSHHFQIISMMMGHGSIKTTHTHYVHGFGVVNAFHALHSAKG